MTQCELSLADPVRLPTAPKTLAILRALSAGERLTVATALQWHGVFALSQECGRLRKLGWPVQSKTVEVSLGVHVSEYSLPLQFVAVQEMAEFVKAAA
jgi:hypothetical protein